MKRILFSILLLIYCSFVLYSRFQVLDHHLLSLETQYRENNLGAVNSGELEKGDIVRGTFKYQYPSLGQLTVRFNNNYHDSEDVLMFRIKEKGSDSWYYQAKYNTDQFLPKRLFPFGFPVISNSSGMSYEFELESLKGIPGRGISLEFQDPVFIAKTIFSKNELLSDKKLLRYFLFHKIFVLVKYLNLFLFAYSPFIVFNILFYLPPKSPFTYKIKSHITTRIGKKIFHTFLIFTITYYLLRLGQIIDDTTIISASIIYFIFCARYQTESRVGIFLATILFSVACLFLIFRRQSQANAYAVWGYILMWTALIQQIMENIFHYHPKMSLEKLVTKFSSLIND